MINSSLLWDGRGSTGFFLPASHLKYSITLCEGSGQTQEAELIGSTQISMGMCDQSLLPKAFPSLHLLLLLLRSVCLIVSARGFPQFPLTSWPLLPVKCVKAALNQFYCLLHAHTLDDTAGPIRPCSPEHASFRSNRSPAPPWTLCHTHTNTPDPASPLFPLLTPSTWPSPHPVTLSDISYCETTREHGHVAFMEAVWQSLGLHFIRIWEHVVQISFICIAL